LNHWSSCQPSRDAVKIKESSVITPAIIICDLHSCDLNAVIIGDREILSQVEFKEGLDLFACGKVTRTKTGSIGIGQGVDVGHSHRIPHYIFRMNEERAQLTTIALDIGISY
jgi:hypothetical protein